MLLAVLAGLVAIIVSSDTVHASTFNPTAAACFTTGTDPQTATCDGSNAPGAKSNIKGTFNLPTGDANFAGLIAFTPESFGVPDDLPIGALVAELNSLPTLGLLNGPCASLLPVNFTFMNASVDINDTIDPLPPGTVNPLQNLALDSDPLNGIPDGADRYPSYLNTLFNNQQPRARFVAATSLSFANNLWVILQFVFFEPGTAPNPDVFPDLDARLGYPSVTVLQDPTAPLTPNPISDFCSSLNVDTVVFGESQDNVNTVASEAGFTVRQNPSNDITASTIGWGRSLWDADPDGLENTLDTCPFVTNLEDPRQPAAPLGNGDPDLDGIDSACDPDPGSTCWPGAPGPPTDCDGDQYLNRADNCPTEPNGITGSGVIIGADNQKDSDDVFGPLDVGDGIGDACDGQVTLGNPQGLGDPNSPDGHRHEICNVNNIEIGAGGNVEFVDIPLGDTVCKNVAVPVSGDGSPTVLPTEEEQQQAARERLLESLTVGLNITAGLDNVPVGGSTPIVASCAEEQDGLEPVAGVEVTFKIDSQPGSGADLDGQAEVTVTSDAEGFAETTLNAGSTIGEIVVSVTGVDCGPAKTTTVTVGQALGETSGPTGEADTGPATGVGSLAPFAASISIWAAIASGLGGAGLLGALGAIASRILRRRRQ